MGWRCAWRLCTWLMGVRRFRWRVEGLVVGLAVGWGAPRDRSCARREARGGRIGFCAARRFFCGSLPMLAPARSRCRLLGVWCGRGVRLSAFGYGCSERFLGFSWGAAESILRSQVSSGEDQPLRCAQVFLWIASNARSGPIPLLLGDSSSSLDLGWSCGGRVVGGALRD